MDTLVARRAWQLVEPVHAITYFAPETRTATDALGLRGGWMSYFGCRAAPLGAVSAAVVTATFYNFHPSMVHRAVPDVWGYASPGQLLEARLVAVDAAMGRLLADHLDSRDVHTAARLAGDAADAADTAGRPLAAGNAALPTPEEPHLALWQATTVLREHRGDGHVSALVTREIGPCEAHVLAAAAGRARPSALRASRRWSEREWAEASAVLAERGWLTGAGALTAAGRELRRDVETETDRLALGPYRTLGQPAVDELLEVLGRLAERVMTSGGLPVPNPVGMQWPPTDEVT